MFTTGVAADENKLPASDEKRLLADDSSDATRLEGNLNDPVEVVETEGKSMSEKVGDERANWAPRDEVGLQEFPRSLQPKPELLLKRDRNE